MLGRTAVSKMLAKASEMLSLVKARENVLTGEGQ